jgi:transcriptional regulator
MLVNNGDQFPHITHLPFAVESENPLTLSSHLSMANPHGKTLQNQTHVTVVFNGPHGYVSPTLYDSQQNVPTWNYIAVHAHGEIQLCSEEEKDLMLKNMITSFEPSYQKQFDSLSDKYLDPMKKAILAFKVRIDKLEGKFKLSQNKTALERERIRNHFAQDGKNSDLAQYM